MMSMPIPVRSNHNRITADKPGATAAPPQEPRITPIARILRAKQTGLPATRAKPRGVHAVKTVALGPSRGRGCLLCLEFRGGSAPTAALGPSRGRAQRRPGFVGLVPVAWLRPAAGAASAATAVLLAAGLALGRSGAALPAAYQVLAHKSIFARDRTALGAPQAAATASAAASQPDIPVFIGALRSGRTSTALLLWPVSGKVRLLGVHEGVPGRYGGIILRITLRDLQLAAPGTTPRLVRLGQNLAGAAPLIPAAVTAPAVAPAGAGSPKESSLIEMMRRRRQQELK